MLAVGDDGTGVFFGPCPRCGHQVAYPGVHALWRCRRCNSERYDLEYLGGGPTSDSYGTTARTSSADQPSSIIPFPSSARQVGSPPTASAVSLVALVAAALTLAL